MKFVLTLLFAVLAVSFAMEKRHIFEVKIVSLSTIYDADKKAMKPKLATMLEKCTMKSLI